MKKLPCPVCSETLSVRLATGRKSGKPFVMLVCPIDGRHIRAFVSDRDFVSSVIEKAGIREPVSTSKRAGGPTNGSRGTTGSRPASSEERS